MTYEQALDWAVDNVPMYMFESFEEWSDEIFENTRLESLEHNFAFNRMLARAWINEFGGLEYAPTPRRTTIVRTEPEVRLPKVEFVPRIQKETEVTRPKRYRSEQFKPPIEKQIRERRPSIRLPYTRAEVTQEKVTFFDRLRRIFTVRRSKK